MLFQVTHQTRYRYSRPVFLEPLTVRLKPRVDFRQRLLNFSLNLDPAPVQSYESIDFEGNDVCHATFADLTASLTLTTAFCAETDDINPFGFLMRPEAIRLPLEAAADERAYFELYARPLLPTDPVAELSRRIASDVKYETLAFVTRLNEWIHGQHEKIVRPCGEAWEPSRTLSEGRGSCRDLALLLMEACRVLNVPSRFISGYSAASEQDEGELHAWVEVYLPGAGWRGLDPSLGLAITDRYLTVAAGIMPAQAAPTTGSYRGDASSELQTEIRLVTGSPGPPTTNSE